MVHFFNLATPAFAAEKLYRIIDANLPQMPLGDELVVALSAKEYPSLWNLTSGLSQYMEKQGRLDLFSGRAVVLQAPDIKMQFRLLLAGRTLTAKLENYKPVPPR